MNPRRRHGPAGLVLAGLWLVAVAGVASGDERTACAAPVAVGVLAPRGSRLADDVRRELESSRFATLAVESEPGHDWRDQLKRLPADGFQHGVAVEEESGRLTLFSRVPGSEAVQIRLVLPVDSSDRLARRRACLGIVEYLHALVENESPASGEPLGGRWGPPGAGASARPRPTPPAGATGTEHPDPSLVAEPRPRSGPSESISQPRPSLFPATSSSLGIGSTLDMGTGIPVLTSHLQLVWRRPLDSRVAISMRALWPVLGAQFRSGADDIRMWTFGVGASLQYTFAETPGRLLPFAGFAVGSSVALTEATSTDAAQGRQALTPNASVGLDIGLLYALGASAQLFFELGAARGWLLFMHDRTEYERAVANSRSVHAAFGALFEI